MKKRIFLISILILICIFFAGLWMSNEYLTVSHYVYNEKNVDRPFTIVQLSDLHNHEFGKENEKLIQKLNELNPDLIFMTGDMMSDSDERIDIVCKLIKEAGKIAPVYYSLGNHEISYMEQFDKTELCQKISQAGAVVLNKKYRDLTIAGKKIRIGGVYGYVLKEKDLDGSEQKFMKEFQDTDRLKILLSHIPEGLLLWKSMEDWDVDLIFSGHVHGGQIRLPFLGGLYDPEEGWLPTYTKGMYHCGKGTMILSAGLGSWRNLPRINNPPEIVVCEVRK